MKTRLAAALGEELAAHVYQVFLETLLWRFGSTTETSESNPTHSVIVYSPENRDPEFHKLSNSVSEPDFWKLQPQGDGDLGERLHRFFATRFADGDSKVIVIGTDSPTMPWSYLQQAKWLLDRHDVVLGPTEDGGYYLVAAKCPSDNCVPPIFTEIEWSTDKVWSQTISRLQENRLTFAVLPTWYDVDQIEDLRRLRSEITATIQQAIAAPSQAEQTEGDRLAVANRLQQRLQAILN